MSYKLEDLEEQMQSFVHPVAVYYMRIMEIAEQMEVMYSEHMKPYKEGIYVVGRAEPAIEKDKRYFERKVVNGKTTHVDITDFNSVQNEVVDEQGNVVITAWQMKNKDRMIGDDPRYPIRGARIVKHIIEQHLATISVRGNRCSYYNGKILAFLKEESEWLQNEGVLEAMCEGLIKDLQAFIGHDYYNMYFVKFSGYDLKIEKCVDHRIYEWTQNKIDELRALNKPDEHY